MSLGVWLHGRRVASLRRRGSGYVLSYEDSAVERLGAERARISYSLPPQAEPHAAAATRAYVEGLLPRGARRRKLANELGIDPDDGYGLIAELGRDCPGAVTFLPEGEDPEPRAPAELAWLDEEELAEALESPPERLFDSRCPQRMRFALPGERHKLALVHDEESGRWAWPEPGAPSTHVLFPESGQHPEFAVNEYVCAGALVALGLLVARPHLRTIAGHRCLVAPRFDRWGTGAGVERLHCENFEQAMGIAPDEELATVTGLVRCRELLHLIDAEDFVEPFFSVAFCAWALGDRDERWGAKVSLMHGEDGPFPGLFYDISSAEVYEARGEKMTLSEAAERCSAIVGAGKIAVGLLTELESVCGPAVRHLFDLDELLKGVSRLATEEGWHEPVIDRIHECVSRRLGYLGEEVKAMPRRGK